MINNKNTTKILMDFYLCTDLPIQALDYNGYNIAYGGYTEKLDRLFQSHNIYEKIQKEIKKKNSQFVTISISQNIYYTGTCISPGNCHSGIFILGPYSCRQRNELGAVYKPKCLMNYMVSLLRTISKDSLYSENMRCSDEEIYSLHVRKAMDFVNYRYMEEITLSSMVEYLNINKSYFSSIFKKETGKTFTQYLNELRIKKSQSLLLETDNSILDIALAVGFNNQNYYNIVFRKIMGTNPLSFRNQTSP